MDAYLFTDTVNTGRKSIDGRGQSSPLTKKKMLNKFHLIHFLFYIEIIFSFL